MLLIAKLCPYTFLLPASTKDTCCVLGFSGLLGKRGNWLLSRDCQYHTGFLGFALAGLTSIITGQLLGLQWFPVGPISWRGRNFKIIWGSMGPWQDGTQHDFPQSRLPLTSPVTNGLVGYWMTWLLRFCSIEPREVIS